MKANKGILVSLCTVFSLLAGSVGGFAQTVVTQDKEKSKTKQERKVVVEGEHRIIGDRQPFAQRIMPPHGIGMGPHEDTFVFLSTEMSFGGRVVKGAPYSAEAVTEFTQTLADGNRIVRKNSATVYRDSEGRTRRDQTLGAIGPFAVAGEPSQTFFINDPVAKVNYILDPRTRTARKLPPPPPHPPLPFKTDGRGAGQNDKNVKFSVLSPGNVVVHGAGPQTPPPPPPAGAESGAVRVIVNDDLKGEIEGDMEVALAEVAASGSGRVKISEPQKESLGKRIIEGVEAEGTRITHTIAAGEIGNEQPINVVAESWYSPELQAVVLSRNSDPRVGENVYRLTNINRSEPARTLFEIPADYTVKNMHSNFRVIERKRSDKKDDDK